MANDAPSIRRVVVTGPESTGKTNLAEGLARFWKTTWIPEYARTYVENLDRPYQFEDVEHIARVQIAQAKEAEACHAGDVIFLDTWLIVTKVWFEVVYGRCPEWIDEVIRDTPISLFLVCDTDLPWIADSVRENGGAMRIELFNRYCQEIRNYGFPLEIVRGTGATRMEEAIRALARHGIQPL